jgi:hypothetical protein
VRRPSPRLIDRVAIDNGQLVAQVAHPASVHVARDRGHLVQDGIDVDSGLPGPVAQVLPRSA